MHCQATSSRNLKQKQQSNSCSSSQLFPPVYNREIGISIRNKAQNLFPLHRIDSSDFLSGDVRNAITKLASNLDPPSPQSLQISIFQMRAAARDQEMKIQRSIAEENMYKCEDENQAPSQIRISVPDFFNQHQSKNSSIHLKLEKENNQVEDCMTPLKPINLCNSAFNVQQTINASNQLPLLKRNSSNQFLGAENNQDESLQFHFQQNKFHKPELKQQILFHSNQVSLEHTPQIQKTFRKQCSKENQQSLHSPFIFSFAQPSNLNASTYPIGGLAGLKINTKTCEIEQTERLQQQPEKQYNLILQPTNNQNQNQPTPPKDQLDDQENDNHIVDLDQETKSNNSELFYENTKNRKNIQNEFKEEISSDFMGLKGGSNEDFQSNSYDFIQMQFFDYFDPENSNFGDVSSCMMTEFQQTSLNSSNQLVFPNSNLL